MASTDRPAEAHLLVLSALARSIAATETPAAVHQAIATAAVASLGAKVARVWVNDVASGTLRAIGSFGIEPDTERMLLETSVLPHGEGMPGRIFTARLAEFIEDSRDDARWVNARYIRTLDLRAYAGIPMVADDLCVGVLSILFDAPRRFTESDKVVAGLLADYAAIAVRVGQLYEERRRADALEAVTHLARATAHELNNPLTALLGNLELLEGRPDDREAVRQRVERIRDAANRVADTVRRMNRIVQLEMFDHSDSRLPPMLDIRRSASEESR